MSMPIVIETLSHYGVLEQVDQSKLPLIREKMPTSTVTETNGVNHSGVSKQLDHVNLSFVLAKPLSIGFEERPTPSLPSGSTDVLVNIKQTGICGSDVHYYTHGSIGKFIVKAPMVLGHESSGVVAAVGSGCRALKVGDRVALEPGVPCRHCKACKEGKYNVCEDMAFAATPPFDGTLCKYYQLAEDFCYKLPDHISFEEGALVEPLGVAVHICRQAKIIQGSSVIVFGAGPIGLLCCAVARAFGAKAIVAVDLQQSRLDFAKKHCGATVTFIPSKVPAKENAAQLVKEACLGEGADVVLEASGAEPSVQTGVHVLRSGGTFVQAGMGKYDITFPVGAIIEKELDFKGSFRYSSGDYELAVWLLESKQVSVKELVTDRYDFQNAEQAFKDVQSGKPGLIKVLISGVPN